MRHYFVTFSCRQIGAIGLAGPEMFGPVAADSPEEAIELARWLAYNTHEHIHFGAAQVAAWVPKGDPGWHPNRNDQSALARAVRASRL